MYERKGQLGVFLNLDIPTILSIRPDGVPLRILLARFNWTFQCTNKATIKYYTTYMLKGVYFFPFFFFNGWGGIEELSLVVHNKKKSINISTVLTFENKHFLWGRGQIPLHSVNSKKCKYLAYFFKSRFYNVYNTNCKILNT